MREKMKDECAMQIVDAQIHLWATGLPSNLSHRQVTAFTAAEAIGLMDEGGVDAAVIHPPGWDPNSTDLAFAAVRDYPGRFAIMGALPLDRAESRTRIAGWRDQPGRLGLRYGFLGDPARRWLHEGALDFKRSDALPGCFDHIIRAAREPEEAVLVLVRRVAAQVPTL